MFLCFASASLLNFFSARSSKMFFASSLMLLILEKIAGQTVTQTEGRVTITEGQPIFLNCTYDQSIDYQPSPFWYIQYLGQPPKLFQSSFSIPNLDVGLPQNFMAIHNKAEKTYHMKKSVSQLNDSAIYLCAVSNYVLANKKFLVQFGNGAELIVKADLKNSNPSVYQLEPKEKQSNLAACLITDYSPDPINVTFNSNEKSVNGSAVVVKEDGNKESASLGVVFWSTKDKFQCFATRGGNNYEAQREGDATCSETQSDTPVFETDENLNLLSLTVLGLRLIFFKSVALNLILTFWAWSR